jgi:hypothetical protein
MAQKNPIEKRLQTLSDQWGECADDDAARILVWQIAADEARMVDAFFAAEAHEKAGEHADLFNQFETAFDNPVGHGYLLRKEFVDRYREGKDGFAQQGIASDWEPPQVEPKEADIAFVIRTAVSFAQHYKLPGAFVLVLKPTTVSDPAAYQLWLHRFAVAAPKEVRAVVLDDVHKPSYRSLIDADKKRVMVRRADLDMPSALEELSKDAGKLDTPGGKYRDLFVRMGTALGKQDLGLALSLGDLALAIAAAQGWFHMAVPIQFALAGSLGAAGRFTEAIARYTAAELAASEGESKGQEELKPTCKLLRMQARLGRGSALIAGGAWGMAAKLYEETAPIAKELGDKRTELDCHRLASFSHEQNNHPDQAWKAGMPGMQVAREMDDETRKTSTFPYLGEGMMRLCTGSRRTLAPQMEREIVALAGTRDWRPKPVQAQGQPQPPASGSA